ncbi:uncharacterized protein LOC111627807 [Centruroides sculpturatus]|uniref:uncharacterized protein LOC111627807 n=1 Tax=Centruroides sculpturatus TaxID=218467 RepID=UPI000C6D7626|nr:uncharacterized protein LOC111627807 [Centruroides sculpturatus]
MSYTTALLIIILLVNYPNCLCSIISRYHLFATGIFLEDWASEKPSVASRIECAAFCSGTKNCLAFGYFKNEEGDHCRIISVSIDKNEGKTFTGMKIYLKQG